MLPIITKIDVESIETMRETLCQRPFLNGDVKVDLSMLSGISLPKFNMLVKLHMEAKREGKRLSFINCHQPKLLDLIETTGFSNVFYS